MMEWRPDSMGLLAVSSGDLYYVPVLSGEPILIDNCQVDICFYCFEGECAWLP